MSEEEIKYLFEKFNESFQEKIFTLISKFNEIKDAFNRVQDGLDFLGKIRMQTIENKQLYSKMDKSFKNLERRLREMSVGGFQIPAAEEKEEKTKKKKVSKDDIAEMLETKFEGKSKKEIKDNLEEFGSADELPSLDEILGGKEEEEEEKEPDEEKEERKPEREEKETEKEPIPAPQSAEGEIEEDEESEEVPSTPSTEKAPESKEIGEVSDQIAQTPPESVEEQEEDITPPPQPAPEINKESQPEPAVSADINTSETTAEPQTEDEGLTPPPKPQTQQLKSQPPAPSVNNSIKTETVPPPTPTNQKSNISPAPQLQPSSTDEVSQAQKEEAPAQMSEKEKLEAQKIENVRGISDVWQNLQIDIKLSDTNEDIAECLNVASRTLKNFVKFHKVLFDLLNKASEFRRKGPNEPVNNDDQLGLLNKVENWKMEMR